MLWKLLILRWCWWWAGWHWSAALNMGGVSSSEANQGAHEYEQRETMSTRRSKQSAIELRSPQSKTSTADWTQTQKGSQVIQTSAREQSK